MFYIQEENYVLTTGLVYMELIIGNNQFNLSNLVQDSTTKLLINIQLHLIIDLRLLEQDGQIFGELLDQQLIVVMLMIEIQHYFYMPIHLDSISQLLQIKVEIFKLIQTLISNLI